MSASTYPESHGADWHAERQTGLGGSDIAAVLGLSPWRSAADVWLEKVGRVPASRPASEAMHWGTLLEGAIAEEFGRRTGMLLVAPAGLYRSSTHPHMIGHVDRLLSNSPELPPSYVLECKTAHAGSRLDWGAAMSDQIPAYYAAQALHYLGITGLFGAYVAVLFGGQEMVPYMVRRDDGPINALLDFGEDWWQKHVVTGTPPPPRTEADVRAIWPASAGRAVAATAEVETAVLLYCEIKAEMKRLDAQESGLRDRITAAMGECDSLVAPDGRELVTFRSSASTARTDWQEAARLAGATDEMVGACTRIVPGSRRLVVKAPKLKGL